MHNWIADLKLERHLEGGYYSVFYKSREKVITVSDRYNSHSSPNDLANLRASGTSIYFLLEKDDFSAWHKIKSDEIWHYYDGNSVINIHTINQDGQYGLQKLGHPNLDKNASFQVVIETGVWFAAELDNKKSFGLVGCTVSPGFEYQDFILANREALTDEFPNHTKIIRKLTREKITAELDN